MSPNSAKKWKSLLQSDHQNQPDVSFDQSSETYENSDFLSHQYEISPDQQSFENDEDSGTTTRHTFSGQLYFYNNVQQKDPLSLSPSLMTHDWDMCATNPDDAGMGSVSQTSPASAYSPPTSQLVPIYPQFHI